MIKSLNRLCCGDFLEYDSMIHTGFVVTMTQKIFSKVVENESDILLHYFFSEISMDESIRFEKRIGYFPPLFF